MVDFHQKPGGDTAGQADPNWLNKTGYLLPCATMLGSWGGSWLGVKFVMAGECMGHRAVRVALCISLFVLYILLTNIVVLTVHFIWCFLLNCPHPDPKVFAFFFPFSSPPQQGEG